MRRTSWAAIIATALVGGACLGTDVGNPADEVEVEMHATGYDSREEESALVLAGDTRVESAWIVLREFRLQRAEKCGERRDPDVVEPLIADLVSSETTYEPPSFLADAGEYCGIDVEPGTAEKSQLPDDAPATLTEHAIIIEGERADDTEFRILLDIDEPFYLVADSQDFELTPERHKLFIGFALDRWIDEAALDAIESDSDDVLVIDREEHPELIASLQTQVRLSAHLFEDRNENGELDLDERREAMAEGAKEAPGADRRDERRDAATPDVEGP